MKKLEMVTTLALVLGVSTACAMPARDTGEANPRSGADASAEQTGDPFASAVREAYDSLNSDFEELVTANARLDGDRAEAWTTTREEILAVREELGTDLDRLQGASTDDVGAIRSRVTDNFESMTHHVERAKLLATDDGDFMSAARQRLVEVDRDIESLQSDAGRLPMEAREDASQAVEDLRQQRNDVEEAVTALADAAPQEIEEQRSDLADDVATLSASVQREEFEMQAELDN
jgi:DNA-directed RNA polymerase subunit F